MLLLARPSELASERDVKTEGEREREDFVWFQLQTRVSAKAEEEEESSIVLEPIELTRLIFY